jgi:2-polyprenyl-3-methyl-5-hydroxy-6-metoxy-1,4-benzoquinol methylase
MRGTLNKMRKLLQLGPVPDIWNHLIGTQPPLLAVDELLMPPDHRWQGQYPYANFLYFDDPSTLDPELEAWLAEGAPPVFVGFGSMSGAGTARIGNLVIEAVKATGLRCVVGAGWAGLGEGVLPPGWRVVRDVPHALLFPRTAVVVHHGGSGTTAQALRAGVPQVILPLILDQFHHAHRMYVAGLAPRPFPMEKITAIQLTRAIEEALVLPRDTRQITAARLQSSKGSQQVAQRLEEIIPGRWKAPHLPPDYALHDATYLRLRERGALGWDAQPEGYIEMLSQVAPALPALVQGRQHQVLELGCGAGNLSVMLAQSGYAVAGVDISSTAIDWATERAQAHGVSAHFRVDNVLELATCKDDAFDAVIDGHCLHCIIGGDRARCLATVLRVLKSGGVFVVLTMCGDITNPHMLETYDAATRTTVHQGRQTRYIGDADSIVAEVAAAGFDIRKVQVISRKDCDDLDDLVVYAVKSDSHAA